MLESIVAVTSGLNLAVKCLADASNQHSVIFNNMAVELNRGTGGATGKGRGSGPPALQAEMQGLKSKLELYDTQITGTFIHVDKKLQEMAMSDTMVKREWHGPSW